MEERGVRVGTIRGERSGSWNKASLYALWTGVSSGTGLVVDRLNPAQNVPLLWDHFLQEFDRQYMDSTREDRARKELSELTMKDYDIDTYIAKFEELSRQASYTIGNQESIQRFEEGLTRPVLVDCIRAPPVHGYNTIKERAIHSTVVQRILDNQFGNKNVPSLKTKPLYPRPFQWGSNRRQPLYNTQQNQSPWYNSSKAPPAYNNQQVPMDVGRAQSRTWREQGGGSGGNWQKGPRGNWQNQNRGRGQANVANAGGRNDNACFKCGEVGHFICNCPQQRRGAHTNLIDFDPDEETLYEESKPSGSRVSHIRSELDAMTFEEKQQMAKELGQGGT
jgi:Retrotransposon gag protein